MSTFSSTLIDALGGTSEVARLMDASISTVHRMRSEPTRSRLNHLRRVAQVERPDVDVTAIAEAHGVRLQPLSGEDATEYAGGPSSECGVADHGANDAQPEALPSPGKVAHLSGEGMAA